MTIDLPVSVVQRAARELAELVCHRRPDVVVTAATLGIPVAMSVAPALGLDEIVVLQKSRKWHLRDSPSIEVNSVTTVEAQRLTLDARRVDMIAGARVAFVDDVISTGSSAAAAVELLSKHGANIVSVAALVTEGDEWRDRLGESAQLVQSLGVLPAVGQLA
ncbi:MAG: phosphoribosyltransferase family protein [Pseudoclavibacter sp.]